MKRIIAAFVLLLGVIRLDAQNIYVVAAGIDDYPGDENDLYLPVNDARDITSLYKLNSRSSTYLLTNEEATAENILMAMTDRFSRAGKNDIIVLFYSGHGYRGGFATYDSYLSYEDIKSAMSASSAGCKMVFANACYSGGLRENDRNYGGKVPDMDLMLFLSSREYEFSWEASFTMRNSFFTSCLLRCLKGGADSNRDRIITAKELFKAVSEGVVSLSDGVQHPVMWGKFDDDMPVIIW